MRIHSPYPASWALAQRIGYLYSEGEIIYLADTPFERLLDIQRQVDWPPESPDNQYHLNK